MEHFLHCRYPVICSECPLVLFSLFADYCVLRMFSEATDFTSKLPKWQLRYVVRLNGQNCLQHTDCTLACVCVARTFHFFASNSLNLFTTLFSPVP